MQEIVTRISQAANVVKIKPTITSTPYSAGDSYGGIQKIANALAPRGSGQLHSLCILDKQKQKPALDIFIFESNPAAATAGDNAAFAFSTDDLKVIGRISVATGDWIEVNNEAICQKSGLDIQVQSSDGSFDYYAVAVTSSTPTQAANGVQFIWGTVSS